MEMNCVDLPPIDDPICTCPECVRSLEFTFTGNGCDGLIGCIDARLPPIDAGRIQFSECDSDLVIATIDSAVIGDTITVTIDGVQCIPDCLDVVVSDPITGDFDQLFRIDTTCDGTRGLILKESYASLDFIGFTCDDNDINNCFQDIVYSAEFCNDGSIDLTLFEFSFFFNDVEEDLLDGQQPVLGPDECFGEVIGEIVDRCVELEYHANVTANATDPEFGPTCEDFDELKFVITPDPLPPTAAPSPEPSPEPTPEPSVGSPMPSLSECGINVIVEPECPEIACNFDRCLVRPFRLLFRVQTRTCEQSDLRRCPGINPDSCECIRNVTIPEDDWPEQKYECEDLNGGPIPEEGFGTQYFVRATPEKDTEIIYFEGVVIDGFGFDTPNTFNATDPDLDEVEANSIITLFQYDNATGAIGLPLQQVIIHTSCSEQLYLLDIFGSFQLIQFESNGQGIIGGFETTPTEFFINVATDGDTLDLDFLNVVILPATDAFEPTPQVIEFDVDGVSIPPPFQDSAPVSLIPGVDFEVITTIGGDINGVGCFDVSSRLINCPALGTPFQEEDFD